MTQLRQRMLEDMQIRNFSENTQQSYLMQVSLFARHFRRSPEGLGPVNIRTYQVYMTNEKKLAPRSILIATCALRFLYTVTLKRPWDVEEVLPMPKAPHTRAAHDCGACICDSRRGVGEPFGLFWPDSDFPGIHKYCHRGNKLDTARPFRRIPCLASFSGDDR